MIAISKILRCSIDQQNIVALVSETHHRLKHFDFSKVTTSIRQNIKDSTISQINKRSTMILLYHDGI